MNTTQTPSDYAQTVRFCARFLLAWTALLVGGCLFVALVTGLEGSGARYAWAGSTLGISGAVAGLIVHLQRVHALAGRLDASLLGRRHQRTLEFPGTSDEALETLLAVLRSQRSLDRVDVNPDRLQVLARLKCLDRYTMDDGSRRRSRQVRARLEPADGVTRVTLNFEPRGGHWLDLLLLDGGRNLDNALVITAELQAAIAERRRAERQAAEKAALEQQLTEARLRLLQAQVEPHFLYNTLAHAQLLTRADPVKAEAMLGHLIDFLRSSLPRPGTGDDASTLGREVDCSMSYLELLKIRMGARLNVVIDVPEALQATPLPPLMLQTLVENAIRHGLEPQPGGGTLWIRAHDGGPYVEVSVADSGAGFQPHTAGTGLGLKNVRDRLSLMFGDSATLTVASNFPSGVTATLRLPR